MAPAFHPARGGPIRAFADDSDQRPAVRSAGRHEFHRRRRRLARGRRLCPPGAEPAILRDRRRPGPAAHRRKRLLAGRDAAPSITTRGSRRCKRPARISPAFGCVRGPSASRRSRTRCTHYRLDRAWQLDYVLQLAEQRGIYLLLCLDYHGMFEVTTGLLGRRTITGRTIPTTPPTAGRALNQNAFFTNAAARTIYQKRLRYLVARYGYSPNLLAWQFFNEIDNVYAYLQRRRRRRLARRDGRLAAHQRSLRPPGHHEPDRRQRPAGNLDRCRSSISRPTIPTANRRPATRPARPSAQSFLQRYGKPVLIGRIRHRLARLEPRQRSLPARLPRRASGAARWAARSAPPCPGGGRTSTARTTIRSTPRSAAS